MSQVGEALALLERMLLKAEKAAAAAAADTEEHVDARVEHGLKSFRNHSLKDELGHRNKHHDHKKVDEVAGATAPGTNRTLSIESEEHGEIYTNPMVVQAKQGSSV